VLAISGPGDGIDGRDGLGLYRVGLAERVLVIDDARDACIDISPSLGL
jgi:hypothetical protein